MNKAAQECARTDLGLGGTQRGPVGAFRNSTVSVVCDQVPLSIIVHMGSGQTSEVWLPESPLSQLRSGDPGWERTELMDGVA